MTFSRLSLFAALLCCAGCNTSSHLVVVNERLGYVKVLRNQTAKDLHLAISRAELVENVRSFDDFYGDGYWGGRMYDVYCPVRGNVYVKMFAFDSSGGYFENRMTNAPCVKQITSEDFQLVYRLLTPWKNEKEEMKAGEKPKEARKWGIFP